MSIQSRTDLWLGNLVPCVTRAQLERNVFALGYKITVNKLFVREERCDAWAIVKFEHEEFTDAQSDAQLRECVKYCCTVLAAEMNCTVALS